MWLKSAFTGGMPLSDTLSLTKIGKEFLHVQEVDGIGQHNNTSQTH